MFLRWTQITPLVRAATLACALAAGSAHAGVPASEEACKRISDAAKLTKTKALIIGYEGLFSSNPINANALSSYRDKLAHGQRASRPLFAPWGSFLTRGPLLRIVESYKNKVEVLVFWRTGNTGTSSIPARCAKAWMAEKDEGRKVIIVGHSFGGGAAWELASSLNKMNVPVDGVVTADPRSPWMCGGECWSWRKPTNVKVWENCYQGAPLKGNPVPGANNRFQGYIGHASVQNSPCFYQGIANRIKGVTSPLTTDPLVHQNDGVAASNNPTGGSTITGPQVPDAASRNNTSGVSERAAQPVAGATSGFGAYGRGGVAGPGTKAERDWMDRATAGTGAVSASVLGTRVAPADNTVRYVKPGGDLTPSGRRRSAASATGSSAPASAQVGGGIVSHGEGGGDTDGPAAEGPRPAHATATPGDGTSALGAVFAGLAGGGGGSSSAPSLLPPAENGTPAPDANGLAPPGDGGASLAGPALTDAAAGATADKPGSNEPSPDITLFERIKIKLAKFQLPAK